MNKDRWFGWDLLRRKLMVDRSKGRSMGLPVKKSSIASNIGVPIDGTMRIWHTNDFPVTQPSNGEMSGIFSCRSEGKFELRLMKPWSLISTGGSFSIISAEKFAAVGWKSMSDAVGRSSEVCNASTKTILVRKEIQIEEVLTYLMWLSCCISVE
jgi:hypothetical protein